MPEGNKAKELQQKIENQIIENNKNYQRYPSDFVHGLLSSHAYKDYTVNDIGISVEFAPQDNNYKYNQYLTKWRINNVYDKTGKPDSGRYYSASYNNDEDGQLVLAHRGTTFVWQDLPAKDSPLKTDLKGILSNNIVAQQVAAYDMTKEVAAYAKEHGYNFSITGHSLGAWLAELSLYFSIYDFKQPAKAVTFDSPGSIVMEDLAPNVFNRTSEREIKDLDITTYLSAPNFVNTCKKHVGKVYRIYPDTKKPQNVEKMLAIGKKFGLDTTKTKNLLEPLWTNFGHSLDMQLDVFDPETGKPTKYDQVSNWPVIKYTPKVQPGQNMFTQGWDYVKSWFGWFGWFGWSNNNLKAAINDTTLKTLIDLFVDIKEGRIDQVQYLKCWENLQKEASSKGYPENDNLSSHQEFSLKYEGKYEVFPVNVLYEVLESENKGSSYWYLKQLNQCSIQQIEQQFGKNSLIARQLKELKAECEVTTKGGKYYFNTSKISTENAKELMLRLITVNPNVEKLLSNHSSAVIVKLPNGETNSLANYLGESTLLGKHILHQDEFNKLDKILSNNSYAIISGEPGFGKTTLATEYAKRQKDKPDDAKIVRRIDADSKEKIEIAYKNMIKELAINADKKDSLEVNRYLTASKNTLPKYKKFKGDHPDSSHSPRKAVMRSLIL